MFIEFGILNYKLLIPLIYPIFFHIRGVIHKDTKPFYELLMNFIGYMLGGLIYLIIKYRMKNLSSENISSKKENMNKNIDDKLNESSSKKDSNNSLKIPTNNINNKNDDFRIANQSVFSKINLENINREIEKKEIQKKNN